jgi:hypothetical protein
MQRVLVYSPFLVVLLMSDLWMWGITPPPAMVALIRVSSSSSPRMASWRWRGVMRLTCGFRIAAGESAVSGAVDLEFRREKKKETDRKNVSERIQTRPDGLSTGRRPRPRTETCR